MGELMPLIVFIGGVLLALSLYLYLCFLLLQYLIAPTLVWVIAAGAITGAGMVAASVIATMAGVGRSVARTIGPEDVNDPALFPKAHSPFGHDHAWPHYLVAQARMDLRTALQHIRARHAKVWVPTHAWIWRDLPVPLVWWPLLLLPYCGLLAYTAGVIVAGVGLGGVIALVLFMTWLGWLAVVGAARGVDTLIRRSRRAGGSCPQCYYVTPLPSYRCRCGQVHRDIRPGRLGALFRRCGCGRLLATTVLRAAAGGMEALCPRCDQALRRDSAVITDVRLPVIGPVSAGKTRLIFAGLEALHQRVAAAAGEFKPTDDHSRREYAKGSEVVTLSQDTTKTPAVQQPVAISVRISSGRSKGLLHVFDAAGEVFADRESNAQLRFLDQAQGLVLVVDPFSIPQVADELDAAVLESARPGKQDPETAYHITAQRLRDHGARLRSLAVAVVKADLLLDRPISAGLAPESNLVRAWLVDKGLENMTLAAERDFAEVRYFLVSSWTGWRATDAMSAAAPLLWLASRAGLPIAEPQSIGGPS